MHADAGRPAFAAQLLEHPLRVEALERASGELLLGEIPDAAQHVEQSIAAGGARRLGEALQVGLDLLERTRIDQVAQLLLAEELAQQIAIEADRAAARRSAFGVSPSYM